MFGKCVFIYSFSFSVSIHKYIIKPLQLCDKFFVYYNFNIICCEDLEVWVDVLFINGTTCKQFTLPSSQLVTARTQFNPLPIRCLDNLLRA